jgi:hypothetical protein
VTGQLVQAVALTAWGNAALRGHPAYVPGRFLARNSSCRFCAAVRFILRVSDDPERRVLRHAPDPDAWFEHLLAEGVTRLRLHYVSSAPPDAPPADSDRMMAAFIGGGGRWLIEGVQPDRSDWWEAEWELVEPRPADDRIWRVTWGMPADVPAAADPSPDPEAVRARFATTLEAIAAFARAHAADNFARAFEEGRGYLTADDPPTMDIDVFPPDTASPTARRLLAAAGAAWVFGGMGSWNDLDFDGADGERYDRLSGDLYALINAAVVAAINEG